MSTSPVPQPSAASAFEAALSRTAATAGPRDADRDLLGAVRAMDAAGEAASALGMLAARPDVVLRLDEAVRWHTYEVRGTREGEGAAAQSPLGLALASCHPDGRVRERAARRIQLALARPDAPPGLIPFLVLRTADWAGPVRERARAALALLLYDAPDRLLPAAAPMALLVARRERGGFARQQVVLALSREGAHVDRLLASTDPRLRHLALQTALAGGGPGPRRRLGLGLGLGLGELAAIARRDTDRRCRELAAEAAVREAVWAERDDLLRQLAAKGHREVRALALIGLIRRGLTAEVPPYLADPSPLVRAVARDATRRTGADPRSWYRTTITSATPPASPRGPGPSPAAANGTTPGGTGAGGAGASGAVAGGAVAGGAAADEPAAAGARAVAGLAAASSAAASTPNASGAAASEPAASGAQTSPPQAAGARAVARLAPASSAEASAPGTSGAAADEPTASDAGASEPADSGAQTGPPQVGGARAVAGLAPAGGAAASTPNASGAGAAPAASEAQTSPPSAAGARAVARLAPAGGAAASTPSASGAKADEPTASGAQTGLPRAAGARAVTGLAPASGTAASSRSATGAGASPPAASGAQTSPPSADGARAVAGLAPASRAAASTPGTSDAAADEPAASSAKASPPSASGAQTGLPQVGGARAVAGLAAAASTPGTSDAGADEPAARGAQASPHSADGARAVTGLAPAASAPGTSDAAASAPDAGGAQAGPPSVGGARAGAELVAGVLTAGVVAGLVETGTARDAGLLRPLLGHVHPQIRVAALRGLRALDAVGVEETVPLLRDPSARVIGAAVGALRTRVGRLPAGLAQSLLADRERAAVRRAGFRLLAEPDPLRQLLATLPLATDPDPRLARWAADASAVLIRGFHTSPWRARTGRVAPVLDPSPEQRRELLALAEAAAPLLGHRSRQLLLEHIDPAGPQAELLRVRHGPHPDTVNRLPGLEATFTARDPHEVIALIREVLLAVLPYAAAPADAWPAGDRWPEILPAWFVERCAPEVREAPGASGRTGAGGARTAWWHGLTRQQREVGVRTDPLAGRRLPEWVGLFDPGRPHGKRSWRWWDAGVPGSGTGRIRVRVRTDGHPAAGRAGLVRLIEAAGGCDVELS